MAVSTVYTLHGILSGATLLSQISNSRATGAMETLLGIPAGIPYPYFVGNMQVNPEFTFDCTQIKDILDTSGALAGIADLSGGNVDLYYKKVTDRGIRVADATTEHKRCRMSQAYLVLDQLSASHKGEASLSCRIGTTYDGTNAPIVPAGSVALAGTASSATHWVAGPVFLNTGAGLTQLPGVQDITIQFNRSLIEVGGDGELYNTFAALASWQPIITVRCLEFSWDTFTLFGSSMTAGSFYLRKVSTTGRVADGTAQHIKFSAGVSGGLIYCQDIAGGPNEPAMTSVTIVPVGDASTAPLTVNTAIAITS